MVAIFLHLIHEILQCFMLYIRHAHTHTHTHLFIFTLKRLGNGIYRFRHPHIVQSFIICIFYLLNDERVQYRGLHP